MSENPLYKGIVYYKNNKVKNKFCALNKKIKIGGVRNNANIYCSY